MTAPALVVGLPLYGRGEHLEEAVESLLSQTRRDVAIVVTDDAPHAGAKAVLEGLHDTRVTYHRNERRLGLIGNWVRVFDVARQEHPGARFFAWGSDHDAWHPLWAERLLVVLEADPRATLAFPLTYRTDRAGRTLVTPEFRLDTTGLDSRTRRLRAVVRRMSAGNMVYGVYRVEALERAGVFRYSLAPDRLLLTELSLQGHLRQLPEWLFYRRTTDAPSTERQREAFWPDGAPRRASLPWSWQHVAILASVLARDGAALGIPRRERPRLLAVHAFETAWLALRLLPGRLYYERLMRRRSLKRLAGGAIQRALGR